MKKLLVACSLALVANGVIAAEAAEPEKHYVTPIEIDFPASPLQVPCTVPYSAWRVWGVRLDLVYGRSQYVYGMDAGVAGMLYGEMFGIQGTALNWVNDDMYGIQAGALGNLVRGDVAGIQLGGFLNNDYGAVAGVQAALCNFDGVFYGLQAGVLNWVGGMSYGVQAGVANVDSNEFLGISCGLVNIVSRAHGLQVGFVNEIEEAGDGVQIGVFNGAKEFKGVQVGLFNVIQNGPLPIMTVVNVNF